MYTCAYVHMYSCTHIYISWELVWRFLFSLKIVLGSTRASNFCFRIIYFVFVACDRCFFLSAEFWIQQFCDFQKQSESSFLCALRATWVPLWGPPLNLEGKFSKESNTFHFIIQARRAGSRRAPFLDNILPKGSRIVIQRPQRGSQKARMGCTRVAECLQEAQVHPEKPPKEASVFKTGPRLI